MNLRQTNMLTPFLVLSLLISGCKPVPPPQRVPLAAGIGHTCALTAEGGVRCWGKNDHGQLGDGTTTNRLTPVDVVGLTKGVVAIDAGGYYTCALTSRGGVKCWGDNYFGQLGDETTTERHTPVDVSGLTKGIQAIAAGGRHACALTMAGKVKCWGDGGALGNGSYEMSATPVDVIGLTNGVIVVGSGDSHTCAITSEGAAKCWGVNVFGELGNGTTGAEAAPVDVVGLSSGVIAIAPGDYHTCALMAEGGVKCWGSGVFGALGEGTPAESFDLLDLNWMAQFSLTPREVFGLTNGVTAIATGGRHTCALTTNGGVKCWGNNESGALGDGNFINMSPFANNTPVDVVGLSSGVGMIVAGDSHTCAMLVGGAIKCWGANGYGQLGNGTTSRHLVPTDVKP